MILIVRSCVVEPAGLCTFSSLTGASMVGHIARLILTCALGFFTRSLSSLCRFIIVFCTWPHEYLSGVRTFSCPQGLAFTWKSMTSRHYAVFSTFHPISQLFACSSCASPTKNLPWPSNQQNHAQGNWYPSACWMFWEVHDDKDGQFLNLLLLFLEIPLEIFVLLGFIVDDVAHDGVECLFGAVGLDFLDGWVEDGALELLWEPITERVVSKGDAVDRGEPSDIPGCFGEYSEKEFNES